MPRARRQSCESQIYHVVARGVGRMNIFEDDDDREEFLRVLGSAFRTRQIDTYAWCLMSNHVHLLVHGEIEAISTAMKTSLGPYARFFNGKHDHVGHLFQGRFTSVPVLDDGQLMETIRYIHRNPSEAGICGLEDYAWSSYAAYVANADAVAAQPLPCSTEFVLEVFGGRDAFRNFHAAEGDFDFDRRRAQTSALLSEAAARTLAEDTLGAERLATIASLDKSTRDTCLCLLKERGLSVRQIERITGIGRNIIQRARPK